MGKEIEDASLAEMGHQGALEATEAWAWGGSRVPLTLTLTGGDLQLKVTYSADKNPMTQEKSRGFFKLTQLSRTKFTLNLGLEVSWLLAWCPYHSPSDPPCSESPKVGPHLEVVDGGREGPGPQHG